MKATIRALLYSTLLVLALAGCGNKGDLVLPDPPEAPARDVPAEP